MPTPSNNTKYLTQELVLAYVSSCLEDFSKSTYSSIQ